MDYETRYGRNSRKYGHCCGNVTVDCTPSLSCDCGGGSYYNNLEGKNITSNNLEGIQCDPIVTYETVVERRVNLNHVNK